MISRLCYQLYKEDWKRSHMISREIEMDSIKNYYEMIFAENVNDTKYTYNDYLEDFGYDGALYAGYGEFCETEYQCEEYMCSLLDNEKLIAMYHEDINTDI